MTPVKASAKTPLTREAFLAEVKKLDIKTTSQQLLAALSLAGQIALNQPNPQGKTLQVQAMEAKEENDLISQVTQEEHEEIMAKMVGFAHRPPGHLDKEEELYLEQQLADMLGFEVTAQLDGQRLNHSIGVMGSEQHLMRFPGDDLSQHDAYREAGIAANRGAFGWFTENGQLTDEAIAREKYYFAVQTMYLTDWNEAYKQLKDWYKFRKMIVINPAEAVAVVGVVGDAGPAQWVKKQFGGSPEVIREGKIWSPKTSGKVILWFVDDPENKVPLGPINLQWGATRLKIVQTESEVHETTASAEKSDDSN
ncbi:MAG TPA: hypothetical protein DIV47_02175 [Candidatus Pacebacteria bacterium]|nr:hypothetical protein [Candidatus Paceibacterota bacterium]